MYDLTIELTRENLKLRVGLQLVALSAEDATKVAQRLFRDWWTVTIIEVREVFFRG